jgi:hypothetical protein
MTPTSEAPANRHDTLTGVPSKGTDRKSIRLDDEHWAKLGKSAAATGKDRTAVLKELIRWFNREPGAELPERPAVSGDSDSPAPGTVGA